MPSFLIYTQRPQPMTTDQPTNATATGPSVYELDHLASLASSEKSLLQFHMVLIRDWYCCPGWRPANTRSELTYMHMTVAILALKANEVETRCWYLFDRSYCYRWCLQDARKLTYLRLAFTWPDEQAPNLKERLSPLRIVFVWSIRLISCGLRRTAFFLYIGCSSAKATCCIGRTSCTSHLSIGPIHAVHSHWHHAMHSITHHVWIHTCWE